MNYVSSFYFWTKLFFLIYLKTLGIYDNIWWLVPEKMYILFTFYGTENNIFYIKIDQHTIYRLSCLLNYSRIKPSEFGWKFRVLVFWCPIMRECVENMDLYSWKQSDIVFDFFKYIWHWICTWGVIYHLEIHRTILSCQIFIFFNSYIIFNLIFEDSSS